MVPARLRVSLCAAMACLCPSVPTATAPRRVAWPWSQRCLLFCLLLQLLVKPAKAHHLGVGSAGSFCVPYRAGGWVHSAHFARLEYDDVLAAPVAAVGLRGCGVLARSRLQPRGPLPVCSWRMVCLHHWFLPVTSHAVAPCHLVRLSSGSRKQSHNRRQPLSRRCIVTISTIHMSCHITEDLQHDMSRESCSRSDGWAPSQHSSQRRAHLIDECFVSRRLNRAPD